MSGLYIVGLGEFCHLYFLYDIGLVYWQKKKYGSNSYKKESLSVAHSLASRQLYPPVSEHVNLYNMRRNVCFLRFENGAEQRCVILVHMYFVLSDKM